MEKDNPQELTERKERILRAVIVEYVSEVEPIASDHLASKYDLGGKAATIRSELAEMAELGYLDQPHSSAGRIPSDRGYRYYVDRLMTPVPATTEEQKQIRAIKDEDETLKELLIEATRILSRLTSQFTAAATIKDHSLTVRHAVVTAMGPDRLLLVFVLSNGHVENHIVEAPLGMTLELIGQINDILLATLQTKTLVQLSKCRFAATGNPLADGLLAEVGSVLRGAAKDLTRGQFITDGEEYILAQPEFHRSRELMDLVLRSLDDAELLRSAIVGQGSMEDKVTIGRENERAELHPLSIARRVFYVGSQEAGAIAIIGPTRLDYQRGLNLLDFTAKAVSDTLTKLYS
jgi:heat-inducible transcriptional repressor